MNVGEMITAIQRRLIDANGTAIASPVVLDSINAAIAYWKQSKFWFNQKDAPVTLTVNSPIIDDLPLDFLYPTSFALYYSDSLYELPIVSVKEYDNAYYIASTTPTGVIFLNGQYQLNAPAIDSYTLRVRYIKEYALLEDTDDLNDFMVYGERLIMYEALSRLTSELQQDDKMFAIYNSKINQEELNLQMRTRRMSSTNRIEVESSW